MIFDATTLQARHMSANHRDCRYTICGDLVLVAGTRYTTFGIYWVCYYTRIFVGCGVHRWL